MKSLQGQRECVCFFFFKRLGRFSHHSRYAWWYRNSVFKYFSPILRLLILGCRVYATTSFWLARLPQARRLIPESHWKENEAHKCFNDIWQKNKFLRAGFLKAAGGKKKKKKSVSKSSVLAPCGICSLTSGQSAQAVK